jgi:imidazolonepropionase-like amidohydrolase
MSSRDHQQEDNEASRLFRGGNFLTPTGQVQAAHGVLVERGRIKRVAPVAEFNGYTGPVHDTTGCTLLPGLIDCHVHLLFAGDGNPSQALKAMGPGEIVLRALENAQKTLRGGVTAVRDCGGKDYLEFAVRDACNRHQFVGPTVRAAGRMICMTGGHGNTIGRIADGPDEVVKAVREQIHAGSDFVKIMATGGVMTQGVDPRQAHYSAAEMMAGVSEATRFGKPSASHAQGTEGILNATRAGISSIEHGIYLDEQCIEEMLASGTVLVPTLAAVRHIVDNPNAGIPQWAMDKAAEVADIHRAAIKAFADAGGLIAMGTDAGTPFNMHGENAAELSLMVDVGMTPGHALVASTVNAADLMRLPNEGRIQDGAWADLLIVDGNPVQDISRVANPENHRGVYKRGTLVN